MADDVFRLILMEGRLAFCMEGQGRVAGPLLPPFVHTNEPLRLAMHNHSSFILDSESNTNVWPPVGGSWAHSERDGRGREGREEEEKDIGNRRCRVKSRGRGAPVPAGHEAEIYSSPTGLL